MLWVFAVLLGQTDVEKDIADLASENYSVRVIATESLRKEGWAVLPRLQRVISETNDPEVKFRCQSIIDYYTIVSAHNIPLIWYLPTAYRLRDNKDLALQYYLAERDKVNELSIRVKATDFSNDYLCRKATQSLIKDMLLDFAADRRTEVLELKWRMRKIKGEVERYESVYGRELLYDNISLPAEEVIKTYEGYTSGRDNYYDDRPFKGED